MIKEYTDTAKTTRIHSEERICGKRATFHVFHKTVKGNKPRFDISYAETPEKACSDMVALYAEVRSKIEVYAFVRCDQTVTL